MRARHFSTAPIMRDMRSSSGSFARATTRAYILRGVCPFIVGACLVLACGPAPRAQSTAATTWTVSIVLPPRLIAGQPATLAVLGVDGRLADGITVDVGEGQRVKTDKSGRAFFTAPTDVTVLIVSAAGNSAAVLIDAPTTGMGEQAAIVAPVVSQVDRFSVCGGGFRGDVDANRVSINGDRAFVLAASPECIVVLASPRADRE